MAVRVAVISCGVTDAMTGTGGVPPHGLLNLGVLSADGFRGVKTRLFLSILPDGWILSSQDRVV
jgi:hypothetical protein